MVADAAAEQHRQCAEQSSPRRRCRAALRTLTTANTQTARQCRSLFAGGVAVVEEHQITQAAVRLGTAQPWVSCQLREVEEEVGVKLFKRVHIEATVMRTANLGVANR